MERMTHRYVGGTAWASIYKVSACGENECKDPIVDRLAAYEDTGLEPEEVAEFQKLCGMYVEAGLDSRFIQVCMDLVKGGATIELLHKLVSNQGQLPSPNTPLTLEELREMDGDPVWVEFPKCQEASGWMLVDINRHCIYNGLLGDCDFENCGKTWLAYRRKPEEGIT